MYKIKQNRLSFTICYFNVDLTRGDVLNYRHIVSLTSEGERMRKTVDKITYDTDRATVDKKFTFGAPGDATGYEETLYITLDGRYFIYTNGGISSRYPREDITPIAHENVKDWVLSH